MGFAHRLVVVLAVLLLAVSVQSCGRAGPPRGPISVSTFTFVHTNPPANTGTPVPHIWIDTNTKVSLTESTVTSSLPCAVKIDYTDNALQFDGVVFDVVTVTYGDGTTDPATDGLRLPMRIKAREYESVNSVAGGRIVTTKAWIISGSIPRIITRAEAFTLRIEGYYAKKDGGRVAFTIDEHFDIKTETATKSAAEVLQDK